MLSENIQSLRQKLDEGLTNTTQNDDALAIMATTAGWEVLKASIEKTICNLLEPGIGGESADLETIGAITLAREFSIEALQGVISKVESTRIAKQVEKTQVTEEV